MNSRIGFSKLFSWTLPAAGLIAVGNVARIRPTLLRFRFPGFWTMGVRIRKSGILLFMLFASAVIPTRAAVISQWTFEASVPTTAGPISPEVGSGTGTASHADAAAIYSNPSGNGSAESWSANRWTVGDYFQFQVDTLGYQDISVSWDHMRNSDGPSAFDFAYSSDGIDFTTVVNNSVSDTGWSSFSVDLSSLSILNNASAIYFRLIAGSSPPNIVNSPMDDFNIAGASPNDNFGIDGDSQIDNFTVNGTAVATAVPDSLPWPVSAATLLAMIALSRRFFATRCSSWS